MEVLPTILSLKDNYSVERRVEEEGGGGEKGKKGTGPNYRNVIPPWPPSRQL
jgi:hypothetical protein